MVAKEPKPKKPPVKPIVRRGTCWPCAAGWHFACTGCACKVCH